MWLKSIKVIESIRWVTSTTLIFLAIQKITFLKQFGLEPYIKLIAVFNLPEVISLYAVIALMIEIVCVIGLWVRTLFSPGVVLMLALTTGGIALNIWSLIFKFESNCGCGLMGDNEYFILLQKLLILGALGVLFINKKVLFENDRD